MPSNEALPVVVIGAGPIGLAAAAHLAQRGEPFVVLEAGASVGASILKWGHVTVFTPWRYCVDAVVKRMLESRGWWMASPDLDPTGAQIVSDYLRPLSELPQIAPHIRLDARVTSASRHGFDKLKTDGRERAPFLVRYQFGAGCEGQVLAKAVIDASGTYEQPNPLGASGVPALGERMLAGRIYYGIPDVLGAHRARYEGKHVLVVGSGHSAFNAVLDLEQLAHQSPDTQVTWAVRREQPGQMFGGGEADQLSQRGALGQQARQLVNRGVVQFITGVKIEALREVRGQIEVMCEDGRALGPFDEIVATTGFRPDLSIASELRLSLDSQVESPTALAPLIDPNVHSCGSVPPHGAEELKHPEPDFYIVGMKSYGRAPTFLMLTGYEQVRSVVAAIAGDWQAAREVRLALPETGVCAAPDCSCDLPQPASMIGIADIGFGGTLPRASVEP